MFVTLHLNGKRALPPEGTLFFVIKNLLYGSGDIIRISFRDNGFGYNVIISPFRGLGASISFKIFVAGALYLLDNFHEILSVLVLEHRARQFNHLFF